MSERALEYDLLKVNVFYSSLMEKTVTDKKDYDVRVSIICTKNWSPWKNIIIHRMAVFSLLLGEVSPFGWAYLSAPSSSWFRSRKLHGFL